MSLHPLAENFGAVAAAYERGRAEYAPVAVATLAAELGLGPGAAVLDLAAGTGKLTRALIVAGLDVVAVEPQAPLREVLVASIGAERAHEGVAEQIPFADASLDAVTVADAFHWFDQQPALTEIRRVLRPGGGLALLSTLPDWRGASWAHDLGTLMRRLRPEHPRFDGPSWQDAVRAAPGWSAPREIRVTIAQPARPERIVDYLASMSWVAAMSEEQRAATLAEVGTLVEAGETPAELPIHFVIGLTTSAA